MNEQAQEQAQVSPDPRQRLKHRSQRRGGASWQGKIPRSEGGEIRCMWTGGPLRRWSPLRISNSWIPYDGGGFVSSYVCAQCHLDAVGVYRTAAGWFCATCRGSAPAAGARSGGNHQGGRLTRCRGWKRR